MNSKPRDPGTDSEREKNQGIRVRGTRNPERGSGHLKNPQKGWGRGKRERERRRGKGRDEGRERERQRVRERVVGDPEQRGNEIREGGLETQGKGRDPEKVGGRANVGGKQRCRKRG